MSISVSLNDDVLTYYQGLLYKGHASTACLILLSQMSYVGVLLDFNCSAKKGMEVPKRYSYQLGKCYSSIEAYVW